MSLFGWVFGSSGLGVQELSRRLGFNAAILGTAPVEYRELRVPKRSGGRRTLQIPNPDLATIQRHLNARLFNRLKAHPRAMGFERKKCIVDHARLHARQAIVLCVDIEGFFPATTRKRIEKYFREIGWNREAARLLTRVTTYNGCLPQGAPTSPRLSNLVNRHLDAKMHRYAIKLGATYSRYADDLVFSFPTDNGDLARATIRFAIQCLRRHGYKMHVKKKLHIRRQHQRQLITGLVVNDRVQLPRETRKWLRAVKHRLASTGSASLTPDQVRGWEALEHMIAGK